ncbi:MAG: type II secretion system F family protein [Rhodoferax sp.]|nr:type II secretion system F family protein [Rhodoferax sp.]
MDYSFSLLLILGFVAVVLLIEGIFVYWNDTRSPEMRRLAQRLRTISAEGQTEGTAKLFRERVLSHSPALQRLLQLIPRVHHLDRLLLQAGSSSTVSHLLAASSILVLVGVVAGLVLRWPWPAMLLAIVVLVLLPWLRLVWRRSKRLHKIEAQLPDAMGLIARALRAGHAFPSALTMLGNEGQEPIAGEFKVTSDEISYGISVDSALNNLATRVPSPDMRYFVMAVVIQRETGGNLAELLDKLAALVRERFKLFAKVRVLAAEGKLSAWILTGLPFCVAGAVQILNPKYLSVLFTDAVGIQLVIGALVMMVIGIFAMWRIIDIRI